MRNSLHEVTFTVKCTSDLEMMFEQLKECGYGYTVISNLNGTISLVIEYNTTGELIEIASIMSWYVD